MLRQGQIHHFYPEPLTASVHFPYTHNMACRDEGSNLVGSNGRAFQAIIACMPLHDTFIALHLGSGIIMKRKPQCSRSIGVDSNPHVIEQFRGTPNIELYCSDAVPFLQTFDFQTAGRVLLYSDPPPLDGAGSEYDHTLLLTMLVSLAGTSVACMISGDPSTLYDSLLSGWRSIEFPCRTNGGIRTEKLWLSFPLSATYTGRNFTDRQRIKRKAERWAANYRALPPAEQLAILTALLECHAPD